MTRSALQCSARPLLRRSGGLQDCLAVERFFVPEWQSRVWSSNSRCPPEELLAEAVVRWIVLIDRSTYPSRRILRTYCTNMADDSGG